MLLETKTTKRGRGNGSVEPTILVGKLALPDPAPRRRGRPPKVTRAPAEPERRGRGRVAKVKIPPLNQGEMAALLVGGKQQKVAIKPPNLTTASITVVGVTPYVQNKFTQKAQGIIEDTQRAGQQARGKKVRKPKDFDENYKSAMHRSEEGWLGIPAPAFRSAMIDACRLVGVTMQHAKLSIFVEADGYDPEDMTPLVRILGDPAPHKGPVRNPYGGADIRWRPMWTQWRAVVRVTWDADQYNPTDIGNLMLRAGLQVGIGEGRPNSPKSNGRDWGRFRIAD
jgi:hypothetical protein